LQDCRAGPLHFVNPAVDVTSLKLDSAAAIEDDVCVQAGVPGVKRAVFDAVVEGQAHKSIQETRR
jgi:hypothetical protein